MSFSSYSQGYLLSEDVLEHHVEGGLVLPDIDDGVAYL